MIGPELDWQQLRAAFQQELEDRARSIGSMLDGLEFGGVDAPLAQTLEELRREAHGLKGAARAVGLAPIERLAHGLEAALEAARTSDLPLSPAWFDAVDRAVDALDALVHSQPNGQDPPAVYLADILSGLSAAAADCARIEPSPSRGPRQGASEVAPPTEDPITIDWKELWSAFGTELSSRETAIRAILARLEPGAVDSPAVQDLDELRREVHSLKGAARAVELGSVEKLAHAVETSVAAAKAVGRVPSSRWLEAIDHAIGAIEALYRAALDGDAEPGVDVNGVLDSLAIVWEEPAPASGADTGSGSVMEHRTVEPEESRGDSGLHASESDDDARPANDDGPVPIAVEAFGPVDSPAPGRRDADSVDAPPPSARSPQRTDQRIRFLTDTVRVSVNRLDALLAQTGELAVAQVRAAQHAAEIRMLGQEMQEWRRDWRASRRLRASLRRAVERSARGQGTMTELAHVLQLLDQVEQRFQDIWKRIEKIALGLSLDVAHRDLLVRSIEEEVMRIRLVSVDSIFGPFERMVRDLLRDQGKEARLVIEGRDTEIDRKVLEQIREPLIHLLRNAVDHGIEAPDSRLRVGKPRVGTIRLSAAQRGDVVHLELADDGAGLDPAALRRTAVEKGLLSRAHAERLDDRRAIDLIFRPGFTTKATVTETSGRGVGMDAVRQRILGLNGHIEVESTPGQGTTFIVRVPLTLATTRALIVRVGDDLFAIQSSAVERAARIRNSSRTPASAPATVDLGDLVIPAFDLAATLGLPKRDVAGDGAADWAPYVILREGEHRAAFFVDELRDEQHIVIKRLGWPLGRVRNVSGATILPNGEAIPILNPFDLIRTVKPVPAPRAESAAPPAAAKPRVLVVDDSLTTRTLQRSILEAAGFDVTAATDGYDALDILQREPFDLVVSDVDMPRLDGLGLTAEIRRDRRFSRLPVVLVTAHESEERRQQGLELGADAYLVKTGFDQSRLLETIRGLL